MSSDASSWTCRAFNVRISGQHFEQYLLADFASRRKLRPHHSQYFASRIFAPAGTLWVSYSLSPCQRARGSLRPGVVVRWRSLIGSSRSQVYSSSANCAHEMYGVWYVEAYRRSRLFPSTPSRAASFRRKSGRAQGTFRLGRLSLDVDPSLEVRAFIDGDALGRNV